MDHHELLLYWSIVPFEILLCVLVYARGIPRRFPFFTAYATILLLSSPVIGLIYRHFGFRSAVSYDAAWGDIGVDLVARCLVVLELCRYELRSYRGIWALCWRALSVLAAFFLVHAAVDAWGQLNRMAIYVMTLERDIDITCIIILLAVLLIRNYYGLGLEFFQRWIAVGIFLICFVDVVNNQALHDAFTGYLAPWFHNHQASFWAALESEVERANEWWSTIRYSAFIIAMSIWCYALRRPLPVAAQEPVLLPAEVYGALSPAVNLRLRAFNDRLQELLRT